MTVVVDKKPGCLLYWYVISPCATFKRRNGVLCRTGQGPSPWAKLEASRPRATASTGGSSGNSVDKAASLMRTGMLRTGGGQRNRGRGRGRGGGRKKGTTRSY